MDPAATASLSDSIETLGLGLTGADLPIGRRFRTVSRTITEADLVHFIGATGMLEVLFTNVAASAGAAAPQRLLPAALVYAFAEGLLIQAVLQDVGIAFLHMELDVKAPTCVGDSIHVRCEVVESRPSRSRPGATLVRTRNEVVRQDGVVSIVYTPLRLLRTGRQTP